MEALAGFEPAYHDFADRCLTGLDDSAIIKSRPIRTVTIMERLQ